MAKGKKRPKGFTAASDRDTCKDCMACVPQMNTDPVCIAAAIPFIVLPEDSCDEFVKRKIDKEMANSYKLSDGSKMLKPAIDRKIVQAKRLKIEQMEDEHGYLFCEEEGCGINASSGQPIDCSHDISVDECQKSARTELAWSVDNITMRCRPCHIKHD